MVPASFFFYYLTLTPRRIEETYKIEQLNIHTRCKMGRVPLPLSIGDNYIRQSDGYVFIASLNVHFGQSSMRIELLLFACLLGRLLFKELQLRR